jgi:cell division protein FtsX
MRRFFWPSLTPTALALALNLPRTRLFRTLGAMSALLAFTVALLAAGMALLQQLYGNWQLQRHNSVVMYLPPETPPAALAPLTTTLPTLAGVAEIHQLTPAELRATLAPLLPAQASATTLPLPVVAEIRLQQGAAREPILHALRQTFPLAELDDQQTMLGRVAESVRGLQLVAGLLAVLLGGLLAAFMALTIRAGLLAQAPVVRLLLQLGATDTALARTITLQTLLPVAGGTALGIGAAALALGVGFKIFPAIPFGGISPWLALCGAPLLLPLLAGVCGWLVSLRLLKSN